MRLLKKFWKAASRLDVNPAARTFGKAEFRIQNPEERKEEKICRSGSQP
jgi:hypothetical protein